MTHVLLVSYYFPPIGGAGAQRPLKFARALSEAGYRVTVLTGPGRTGGRWTPPDPTLELDVPADVEVLRISSHEPEQLDGLRNRVYRVARLKTKWTHWWQEGLVATGARARGIDAIYTTMSPYSSAEASIALARRFDAPWIADLGDPWALDEMMLYPTAVHRRFEMRRMRSLLNSASGIVMTTPEAVRQIVTAFPELSDRPVVSISNGYDEEDFAQVPEGLDGAETFRIVHTGYLHTELGLQQRRTAPIRRVLGGETPGVDILTRSHVHLLEAVDRVLARDPSLRDRIEVHLAGVLTDADRQVAGGSPVTMLHEYLSHADSIALMCSADLLFLPLQNLPAGRRSSTVPGKTYEYMAAGRPILGAVPAGDARDLLEQYGAARICAPDDVDAMAEAIESAIAGRDEAAVDRDFVKRFSYSELGKSVAAVIDECVSRSRRTPTVRVAADREGETRELNALLLAYYFPPIGGAGAQRSLKFVRYFPVSNVRSTVLTGPGSVSGRWTPTDETLSEEIPSGTRIVRLGEPEPPAARGWSARGQRWLRFRPAWSSWWVDGVVEAGGSMRDVDVIIASASPYDSFEAAARLAKRLGKPWIAGLRDPWALDEMMLYPTEAHRRLELARMRRLLSSAAAIVTTTPECTRQLVERFPELSDRPVVSIPNGFDRSDFVGVPAFPHSSDKFRIVHTGYLHTELGLQQQKIAPLRRLLGGATPNVNILTRSHVYLLQAVDRLLARNPGLRDRLEVHFAGVLSETDRRFAEASPVTVLHGYLSHHDSIALMSSADLLFLPMQNLPPGRRSSTVPGKTYEYLATGRPILGAVPAGDARDILTRVGHTVCDPDDVAAIARAIEEAVSRVETSAPPAPLDTELVESFERRVLAQQMADVVRSVALKG